MSPAVRAASAAGPTGRPSGRAALSPRWLIGFAMGLTLAVALILWQAIQPAETPVDRVLDPRGLAGGTLLITTIVALMGRVALATGRAPDPRRARGAWIVGLGGAAAFAALIVMTGTDRPSPGLELAGYGTVGAGLLAVAVGGAWWGSWRALPVLLAAFWVPASVTAAIDVGWQLRRPYIAPFTPCQGGMDCIGVDPSPPMASDWVMFGALFGFAWIGGALLVVLALAWTGRKVAGALRS